MLRAVATAALLPVLLATAGTAAARTATSWGRAAPVPGASAAAADLSAGVTSLSCASPGNCTATGAYGTGDSDCTAPTSHSARCADGGASPGRSPAWRP
jgi:hypothetical protein